jgi:ABC-type phosphate/phosphonate transport system substrate-binding protein
MYDWPEVSDAVDDLWGHIAAAAVAHGVDVPSCLSRPDQLVTLWSDPRMILGQVCALNPVRDGLGETEVIGTIEYLPPPGLPQSEPGSYYSVIVCRADDVRRPPGAGLGDGVSTPDIHRFSGARVASNGTDSQSGYWSLGYFVRDHLADGPIFGDVVFTGAHRESVRAVASGSADVAAIDVHSWRLACEHEPDAVDRLAVIGTTEPTPGVVCVVSWELAEHRAALDAALADAVAAFVETTSVQRVHVGGYRRRHLDEFEVVADRVESVTRHPWHACPTVAAPDRRLA